MSDNAPARLGPRLLRAAPVIIVVAVVTLIMEQLGWLDSFETAGIDAVLLMRQPREMRHVSVVALTQAEYEAEYAGRRVLVHQDLERLIDAVARGGAAIVGIDLDTSAPQFANMRQRAGWPPIVWAAGVTTAAGTYMPGPVVGGAVRETDNIGVDLLPIDPDGVVRRYQRDLPVNGGMRGTFPWAVVQAFCRTQRGDCPPKVARGGDSLDARLIDFTGTRNAPAPISFHEAMALSSLPENAPDENKPLAGRIVLIGAIVGPSCDILRTPMGQKPGVFVMAEAIESELAGGGIQNISPYLAFIIDVAVGILIVVIQFYFAPRVAVLLSILAIPVLSLAGSYLAFASFARWFNFVPMIVAVLIHELYDQGKAYRDLRQAYDKLSAQR